MLGYDFITNTMKSIKINSGVIGFKETSKFNKHIFIAKCVENWDTSYNFLSKSMQNTNGMALKNTMSRVRKKWPLPPIYVRLFQVKHCRFCYNVCSNLSTGPFGMGKQFNVCSNWRRFYWTYLSLFQLLINVNYKTVARVNFFLEKG